MALFHKCVDNTNHNLAVLLMELCVCAVQCNASVQHIQLAFNLAIFVQATIFNDNWLSFYQMHKYYSREMVNVIKNHIKTDTINWGLDEMHSCIFMCGIISKIYSTIFHIFVILLLLSVYSGIKMPKSITVGWCFFGFAATSCYKLDLILERPTNEMC